jgi:hypothetical protein
MEQLDCLPVRPRGRIDHENVRWGLHHFYFVGGLLFCASIPHELLRFASLGTLSIVAIHPHLHPHPE